MSSKSNPFTYNVPGFLNDPGVALLLAKLYAANLNPNYEKKK